MSGLSGPPPPLPSVDELIAYPYTQSAFSQGMTSDDARQYHRDHGERIRWFEGYEDAGQVVGPNGETPGKGQTLLIEQFVADTVRALFSQSKTTIQTAEFGIFEAGTATVSCMPDEIDLARGDRLIRVERRVFKRCKLEPSGEQLEILPWGFVTSIRKVLCPSGEIPSDEYVAVERGLRWQGVPPQTPLYVEFCVHPQLEYCGEDDRLPPLGTDDKSLPKIGVVRLDKPGD